MIRIILVDDHALVREGVSRLLEAQPDMRVVGSFDDGNDAIRFATREKPDVAIVDIAMPQESGIDIAREMRNASPVTQILVLSMYSNPEYVHQALLAGALGYVAKESAGPELVEAVRVVQAGGRYLCKSLGPQALHPIMKGTGGRDALGLLSAREREVLHHTVEGHTIAETAQRLGISPKTVETYRSRVMTKLAVDNQSGLIKFAIRHGITGME